MSISYKKPAFYDDFLTVKTTIKEIPSARITFYYETLNSKGELLNTGEVVLVFMNKKTSKPCLAPAIVLDKLNEKLV